MSDKPDDRPRADGGSGEPRIFAIVGGKKFPLPGLETFFAAPPQEPPDSPQTESYGGCSCHPVAHAVCACMKVCQCVGHTTCSCVGHSSSGRSGGYGCRCAPVH